MVDIHTYADELLELSKEHYAMCLQRLALAQATIKTLQAEVEDLKKLVQQPASI